MVEEYTDAATEVIRSLQEIATLCPGDKLQILASGEIYVDKCSYLQSLRRTVRSLCLYGTTRLDIIRFLGTLVANVIIICNRCQSYLDRPWIRLDLNTYGLLNADNAHALNTLRTISNILPSVCNGIELLRTTTTYKHDENATQKLLSISESYNSIRLVIDPYISLFPVFNTTTSL